MKRVLGIAMVLGLVGALTGMAQEVKPGQVDVVDLGEGVKLEMVLIPAGKFKMGFAKKEIEEFKVDLQEGLKKELEKELGKEEIIFVDNLMSLQGMQHEVTLTKPYYMGKYEVTQEQWVAVMNKNPSTIKGAKLPVTNVSWIDCQEFIKKLNEKTKGGYRLPTEAEWEYACRAGTKTAYSFGDKITPQDANYWASDTGKPVAVGSYKPNAFGLYDMHGNVLEYCLDWHRDYPSTATTPKDPLTEKYRALRGGAFQDNALLTRSSYRILNSSIENNHLSGLRLVKTADSKGIDASPTETRPDPTGLTPSTRNEQFTFNKQDPSKQSTTEIKPPVKAPITLENINEYYGVVTVSQNTGRYGFCFAHHKDKQEAANHALSFCNARDAKVVLCVKNQWFALASGGGGAFGWAHGSDPDEVRERAINECLRFSNTAQIVVLDHSNNKNHLNQSLKSTSTKPGWDKSDVSSDIKKDYDKILKSHHKGIISEIKSTFAEFPDIKILVWKNAAEIGNTYAMALYAKHLEYAQTPDLEKSLNYMKKAAQNENAFAMTELAYFYIYGKGIPKNIDEGIQWLRKASELEDPQAMSSLAYYFRDKYKDSENAFFWARKGSNLGNTNAIIQLAHCYYHGFGVDKNEAECFRLYSKAADLGNPSAVNNVGVCYAKGIGVDEDDKKSFEMYLKSAELGYILGMYNVANCYKNGKGTPEDREKAIKWYKKSAKYGDARSGKTLKEMGIDY